MFKKISKLFGGKKDEEFMNEPRRVPGSCKDIPDGDNRWVMSREFALAEDPSQRIYLYIAPFMGYGWDVGRVVTDLKSGNLHKIRVETINYLTSIEKTIKILVAEERKMRDSPDYIPVPQSYPTYVIFANRHGLHFDDAGNLRKIEKENPLLFGTIMPRRTLDVFFNAKAAQTPALNTWEGFYARVVNDRLPQGSLLLQDLVRDAGFSAYRKDGEKMLESLENFINDMQSSSLTQKERLKILEEKSYSYPDVNIREFSTTDMSITAHYICKATLVLGFLQAGNGIYKKYFEDGNVLPPGEMEIIRAIGWKIESICMGHLGLSREESRQVASIIGEGPDSHAHTLPLRAILQTPPPPKDTPKIEL